MSKKKINLRHAFHTVIWPKRKLVFFGLILIFINRGAGLILPGSSKYLIDEVIADNNIGLLKILILVVVLAITVQAVTSFLLTKMVGVEAQRYISVLRTDVQKKVLSLPISYFDSHKSGELVSRIMSDVEGIRNLIGTGLVQLIGGIITALVSLVLLLNISPWMTIYVIIPISLFAFIATKAFAYIRPILKKRSVINADVTGRLTETLSGIRVIKGFNAEKQEQKIFSVGVERLFQNVNKSMTASSLLTSSSAFLLGMASVGIMGIGGYLVMQNEITVGDFIAFTLYLGFMIAPIAQMSNIGTQITDALAGLDRTEELMNLNSEDDDDNRTLEIKNIDGNINFQDVCFAYTEDNEVLHNISFDAPAGSVTALVGTSGSGKSTIAGLAASFLNPTSGKITLDDTDLSKVLLHSYRKNLGVVLQDDFLFEGTIRENILFPRPESNEAQLRNAVQAAYVNEFTDRFELGLDTTIGERGVKLSGGQRQRIAIARAVLADPKIIILDEATSNLDTESEAFIQKSLAELMKGRTTFVIAHRLSTIRKADQILVVEDGHIAERGTHDDLIAKEGRYYELFTYQSRI